MTDVQKFYADVNRIIRHDRADNNGQYNGIRASKAVAELFIKQNYSLGDLPTSIADYWLTTYIDKSKSPDQEPTTKNVDWLGTALSLLDGTPENTENFSKSDWQNLKDFVNYEAEELPLEILSSLMTIFVDNKVI